MKPHCSFLTGAARAGGRGFALLLVLLVLIVPAQAKDYEVEQQRIERFFPRASVSAAEGEYLVRTITNGEQVLGYAFQSINVVDIPAYSGKPINMHVLLDPKGMIVDAYVLEHHEPILLIGIPEEQLHAFTAKYQGIGVDQRVVVGRSRDKKAVTIDAVTGATVTVMVVNEIVMRAARDVAVSLGLVDDLSLIHI